jgi:hypothetical protein
MKYSFYPEGIRGTWPVLQQQQTAPIAADRPPRRIWQHRSWRLVGSGVKVPNNEPAQRNKLLM